MRNSFTFKIVIPIIILTALILGISIFSQKLLNKDSDTLVSIVSDSERAIYAKNWTKASADLDRASEDWSSMKGTWSALIDHMEIDNIDVTLARLKELVMAQELPSSLSEAAALKKYIGHIPVKERLMLENVF